MKTNKRLLMKHFAAVLRKRALSTVPLNEPINPQILKFFTRKDLIQIIQEKNNGVIPKEHNFVELENEDLLEIIGDDMYLISHMTRKWCHNPEEETKGKRDTTSQQKKPIHGKSQK